MVAVIAILITLMTAGVSLLNGTSAQSRRAGADLISGLVEQARTNAITSRSYIVLAIAEPGDLPAGDERCRVGMFKVEAEKWPAAGVSPVVLDATLMNRWQTLNTGIVLLPGDVDGIANPMDPQKQVTINYGGAKKLSVKAHAIAFHSRGGLHFPAGSAPIMLRIAEGGYRGGEAKANERGPGKVITETRLKINRVIARAYRIDG